MQTKVKTDTGRSTNGTTSSIRKVKRPNNYVMADDTKQSMSRTITKPQTNRVANTVKRVGGAVGEAVMGAVTGGTSKRSLINQIAETRTPKVQSTLTKSSRPLGGGYDSSLNRVANGTYSSSRDTNETKRTQTPTVKSSRKPNYGSGTYRGK